MPLELLVLGLPQKESGAQDCGLRRGLAAGEAAGLGSACRGILQDMPGSSNPFPGACFKSGVCSAFSLESSAQRALDLGFITSLPWLPAGEVKWPCSISAARVMASLPPPPHRSSSPSQARLPAGAIFLCPAWMTLWLLKASSSLNV